MTRGLVLRQASWKQSPALRYEMAAKDQYEGKEGSGLQVTSTTAATASTVAASQAGSAGLGKNDFLKLLIAQLRNQDPLKPMEDKEFIAQLAQFNTLEEMQQMNQSIEAMATRDEITQSSALLGKQVAFYSAKQDKLVEGLVDEVRIVDGKAVLIIGGQAVALEQVRGVREADNGD